MASAKKVLMVIAPENFRDEEYEKPKAVLEREGIKVETASSKPGERKGTLGKVVTADLTLSEVNLADFDGIVFVGGVGAVEYFTSPLALDLIKEAEKAGKIIGAICIASSILANAGILKGKEATAFPSEEDNLKQKGANYTGDEVTVSENIITARGPDVATKFGEKLAKALGV